MSVATPKVDDSEPMQMAMAALKRELELISPVKKREFKRLMEAEREIPCQSAKKLAEMACADVDSALRFTKKRNACRRFLVVLKKRYTLTTRQGYLVDVRRILDQYDPQARQFMQLSDTEIERSRSRYRKVLVARHKDLIPLDPYEWKMLVGRTLDAVMESPDTGVVSLGVALMAATGRRQVEILCTGNFSPYEKAGWLWFTGQAKTRGRNESIEGYAIPCLADAKKVLECFGRLRTLLGSTYDPPEVHRRYAPQLGRRTVTLFGPGFHPHLLRAAYGFVTHYEWCPENMTEEAWLALVLGHKVHDDPDLLTPLSYKRFYLRLSNPPPSNDITEH